MLNFYFLGIGTNLGDRQANIERAVELLREKVDVCKRSSTIETEPWGFASDNRFLNAVVEVATNRSPREMLAITQDIERRMGRTEKSRDGHYADRTIDIDLLLSSVGSKTDVVYAQDLRLPHPAMWQRDFVLRPLAEIDQRAADTTPRVATIGYFDGVHIGHQHLVDQVAELATPTGRPPLLITFNRHPRSVAGPNPAPVPALATKLQRRKFEFRNGVDIAILDFTPEMAALSAREFMHRVLHEQLNVGALVIGYDHHFGRPAPGEGFEDYCRYGEEVGISVHQAAELATPLGHVSSSAIRRALSVGDIPTAGAMLGRRYEWAGEVVHGHELGRRLGFPTANLQAIHPELMLPANGVYAAWATLPGSCDISLFGLNPPPPDAHIIPPTAEGYKFVAYSVGGQQGSYDGRFMAMVNIGTRPTVDDSGEVTVEAHILDFKGDLYDKPIHLYFVQRIRSEQHFADGAALAAQLSKDKENVRAVLTDDFAKTKAPK